MFKVQLYQNWNQIQEKYDISLIKLVSYSLITKFQISIENISEDNVTMK